MIPTSSLNKLILFQSLQETVDEYGIAKKTWTDDFQTYANMYIRPSGAKVTGHSETPMNDVIWKIRYHEGITYDTRIKYNGNYYKITFIEEMGRRAGISLTTYVVLETYIT
jgi:SPP1 family predicted phage head-tail adaptor